MAATKFSLKLLVDKKSQRVLFAEVRKDFVDFLFSLLSLPLGTVVSFLTTSNMVGCFGNLYESLVNLDGTYMQTNKKKEVHLKPNVAAEVPLLVKSSAARKLYQCPGSSGYSSCRSYVTDDPLAVCPSCSKHLDKAMTYVVRKDATTEEAGLVKGVVMYMVMDDLVVKPLSTTASIAQLNKFNVKEVGVLEERVVDFGMDEGLKLLRESLQSKTVLTRVLLRSPGIKTDE